MVAAELLYREALTSAPGRLFIINAAAHPLLTELTASAKQTYIQQHQRPPFLALQQLGLSPPTLSSDLPDAEARFDTILLLPAKNKQQTLGWMAEALRRLTSSGIIISACANAHGAKSYAAALRQLAGTVASRSKSKCRIFSATTSHAFDAGLAKAWRDRNRAERVSTHGLISRPGLFSWDRPDRGSELLIEHLPQLAGCGMDLCCGYGLISCAILNQSSTIKRLHLLESDQLALECAIENTKGAPVVARWCDATQELLPDHLDWIVCNPPFHSAQERDVGLGQTIVRRACGSLKRGGSIWLVANRQLPYEQLLREQLQSSTTLFEGEGFKIIKGVR